MWVCPHCGETVASDEEECPRCSPREPDGDLQETRPFHQTFEKKAQPTGDLRDTVRQLPVIDDPEPDEVTDEEEERDFRSTLVDGKDAPPPSHLAATLVDTPPAIDAGHDLGDTLLEIQPRNPDGAAPITFSDVPAEGRLAPDGTGAEPLNFQEFESTKDRSRRAKDGGQAEPASLDESREPAARPRARLPRVLAWITSVTWVALAVVLVTGYLKVPVMVRLMSLLPFEALALTALPATLLLATVIAAGRRLLLWVLLAALPGLGLVLGLFGAMRLILRRPPGREPGGLATPTAAYSDHDFAADRSVGWMLVFFTLAWQEEILIVLLTHFRAYLPW
jgi:hypothetical protein